jgi:hypothetical protein
MKSAEAAPVSRVRVLALVDEQGKVLEARAIDGTGRGSLAGEAKSMTLLPISWPEHSIRSVRTIELRQVGGKWFPGQSYVVQPAEPPAFEAVP